MIRSVTRILAAAGSVTVLAGGMALAGAGSASAASLPSCANGVKCVNTSTANHTAGEAGYFGADDNHTHYRYVQTEVTASQALVNLNGTDPGVNTDHQGAVGVELCDPNDFGSTSGGPGDLSGGFAAQLSLGFTASTGYVVRYRVGFFAPKADPCIQNGFTNLTFQTGQPLDMSGISAGDTLTLAIWYAPWGHHFHQISFGVCDLTSGVCRQAYNESPVAVQFFEFGIGAFANHVHLTGGPVNKSESFADNDVTCYSCAHMVPITSVAPVGTTAGGLEEAQFTNATGQVQLSPLDSLSASADTFNLWEGSTTS